MAPKSAGIARPVASNPTPYPRHERSCSHSRSHGLCHYRRLRNLQQNLQRHRQSPTEHLFRGENRGLDGTPNPAQVERAGRRALHVYRALQGDEGRERFAVPESGANP